MNLRDILTQDVDSWGRLGHPALLDRFVLRNGKTYTPAKRKGRKGPAKQCFMNAARIAMRDPGATYVEGFVTSEDLPIKIHHAWVTYDGKTAMDPTLDAATHEYFGVEFGKAALTRELAKNGVYGLLDPGLGLNADLMFKLDPDLKAICDNVKMDPELMKLAVNHLQKEKTA